MYSSEVRSTFNHVKKNTDAPAGQDQNKRKAHRGNSDGTIEKTDEESSYSSFYSSFFKTESGSTEESDVKNREDGMMFQKKRRAGDPVPMQGIDSIIKHDSQHPMKVTRMEQVCLTSELIYKYQILTKSMEEVLSQDKEKLQNFEQPSMVNEQLGQLYLDLQLEGVAARLTLEEGITSSSSSGEETSAKSSKTRRRKREYSKLVMIYEEDAPLPPPEDAASSSTS